MTVSPSVQAGGGALSTRLSRLARLEAAEMEALRAAEREARRWPARREIMSEGEPVREARAVMSGWACRQRILSDGRRQILGFLMPGDLLGICRHGNPLAATTILAVTELVTCPIPPAAAASAGLAEAYALSAALEEHYMFAQITRLGRLSAPERMADWLLETQERLVLAGLAVGSQLPVPLTQEFLADTLGLTNVHINRTLQTMRRDGLLTARGGVIQLLDEGRLRGMVDYRPARVTLAG